MPIIMNWLSFVFFDFIFQLWSSFWLHRLSINGCSTGSGSNYDIFIIFESEFKFRIIYGNQFQLTMRLVININLRLHFHSNIRSTFNYYYFIDLKLMKFVYVNVVIVVEDALEGMKKKTPTLCQNKRRKFSNWNGNRCFIYIFIWMYILLFQWDWKCRLYSKPPNTIQFAHITFIYLYNYYTQWIPCPSHIRDNILWWTQ